MPQVQDWLSLWTLNENDRHLDISNNRRPKPLAKYIPKFLRATAAFPEELLRCNFRGEEKKLPVNTESALKLRFPSRDNDTRERDPTAPETVGSRSRVVVARGKPEFNAYDVKKKKKKKSRPR